MTGAGIGLGAEDPVWIGRRQSRVDSLSTVKLSVDSPNTRAGLSVRYDESSHYDIEYADGKIIARSAISSLTHEVAVDPANLDLAALELYIEMTPPGPTFFQGLSSDLIRLGYIDSLGAKQEVAVFDGRYLSAEVTASFTGRVIGFYVIDGEITVKEYSELPQSEDNPRSTK